MGEEGTTEALQDLGHEFGCPPGIRVADWLRARLKQLAKAEAACREYVDGGFDDPGRAIDKVRDALGVRA